MKFKDFNLSQPLLDAVDEMGFEEATPIQAQTIQPGLEGRDVLGQAQTGTGKTAAFGLPLLEKVSPDNDYPQALVIAPTRELAIQNGEELYRLGHLKNIRIVTVYGGANIRKQLHQLQSQTQVVVGTPGRLIDLINRGALKLNHVETLVLDEADEMLDMGFIDDIRTIMSALPDKRQTLLFSATIPDEIQKLATQFMTDPVHVKIQKQVLTAENINQYYTRCHEWEKFDTLSRFLDVHHPQLAIVFARTKRRVAEIAQGLVTRGYSAMGLHGDMDQYQRNSVMSQFKEKKLSILVATDVAARGLDISGVTHVYNYDIPQDPESYVHRIGRTGRAGHSGLSLTFVDRQEVGYLRTIEDLTKQQMTPLRPPTENESLSGQVIQAIQEVAGLLEWDNVSEYEQAIDTLMNAYTDEELATALLHSLIKDYGQEVKISPDHPLKPKHNSHHNGQRKGKFGRAKNYNNHSSKHHSSHNNQPKKRQKSKQQAPAKKASASFKIK